MAKITVISAPPPLPPPRPEKKIILELSELEARALIMVTGAISGKGDGLRGITDGIYYVLTQGYGSFNQKNYEGLPSSAFIDNKNGLRFSPRPELKERIMWDDVFKVNIE
jgi:hypothetical protein